ncbi:hypothetical protein CL614_10130 [archaeon]|nr:hypothetical protein [archaeon]
MKSLLLVVLVLLATIGCVSQGEHNTELKAIPLMRYDRNTFNNVTTVEFPYIFPVQADWLGVRYMHKDGILPDAQVLEVNPVIGLYADYENPGAGGFLAIGKGLFAIGYKNGFKFGLFWMPIIE